MAPASSKPLTPSRPPGGSDSSPSGLFLILMLLAVIVFISGLLWML